MHLKFRFYYTHCTLHYRFTAISMIWSASNIAYSWLGTFSYPPHDLLTIVSKIKFSLGLGMANLFPSTASGRQQPPQDAAGSNTRSHALQPAGQRGRQSQQWICGENNGPATGNLSACVIVFFNFSIFCDAALFYCCVTLCIVFWLSPCMVMQ